MSVEEVTSPSVPLNDSVEGDHQHCLVCYSTLDHPGILPCDHNEVCGVCHLRLRHLHSNRHCPICKTDHEKIIVDTPGKSFGDYPMWGDDLGINYVFRQDVGMFFPADYYQSVIEPLFGYHCTEEGCQFDGAAYEASMYDQMQSNEEGDDSNNDNGNQKKQNKNKKPPTPLRALQDHLRVKHRLTLCNLCIEHKRDFVALLPRMTPNELKRHMTKGDGPGSGFEGHPVCEFCRPTRFYDLQNLHVHLRKEHYLCFVCEKQGLSNQYFRNYQALERHFDRSHFLCHDVQCLQARFVVFENEIDLHAHERQVHGGTSAGSSKIQLAFQTRRTGYDGSGMERQQEVPSEEDFNYGLQGEAFVPDALPQSNDLTLHPLHMQRTAEFRAQAAQIREQQQREMQVSAFPSLNESAAGDGDSRAVPGQRLNIGWASQDTMQRVAAKKKNAGAVTDEDFPTLPTSAAPERAADAKLRAGANRQFAAMNAAATRPVRTAPALSGWAGSAAAVAAQPAAHQNHSTVFAPTPAAAGPPPRNRTEDLTPDNFPALSGGTKKGPKYAAATNLAKKYQGQQQPPSWNSAVDFPAPPSLNSSAKLPTPATATQRHATPTQMPPSLTNQLDFPPPPSANATNNSVKQKMLGPQKKQPSKAAMSSMLQMPQTSVVTPGNPQETLRDMQASLGPAKYKKLKNFTREFADNELAPDSFIDHAAALFDRGYGDPDFWRCIPALVASCPNEKSSHEALRYMESLRSNAKTPPAPAPSFVSAQSPPTNNWNSSPLHLMPASFPTPLASSSNAERSAAASSTGHNYNFVGTSGSRIAAAPTTRYVVPDGKKKNVWGRGAPAPNVMQAKKTPVSVASAAANEAPQVGTATKFMAKHNKQQKQQSNSQNNQNAAGNKKNKKKEKDELRKLAFGR